METNPNRGEDTDAEIVVVTEESAPESILSIFIAASRDIYWRWIFSYTRGLEQNDLVHESTEEKGSANWRLHRKHLLDAILPNSPRSNSWTFEHWRSELVKLIFKIALIGNNSYCREQEVRYALLQFLGVPGDSREHYVQQEKGSAAQLAQGYQCKGQEDPEHPLAAPEGKVELKMKSIRCGWLWLTSESFFQFDLIFGLVTIVKKYSENKYFSCEWCVIIWLICLVPYSATATKIVYWLNCITLIITDARQQWLEINIVFII